jgi:hypothetical protein
VCSVCWACGDRPDPPGPAEGAVTVLESQPRPEAEEEEPPPADVAPPESPAPVVDAGEPAAPAADLGDDDGSAAPGGGGPVLAACLEDGGGCTVINIAVLDEGAGSCVELVVDNCGTFTRAGLPVDTPVTWRLGSASVGDLEEGCVPAAYDPDSAIVVDGAGSISWNLDTRRPSDLVVDLSLEAASSAAIASPIGVAGTFAGDIPDCES